MPIAQTAQAAPAPIQYLDGIRFKRIVIAAADRIIRKQKHLDEINVFPVPDGDTGANMAGTMRAVVEAIRDSMEMPIDSMSKAVAESALMGARGNSGVILAQFLTGFSEGVKNLGRVTPSGFVDAAHAASELAREAMESPQEGTILTVIQDWVAHLRQNREAYTDFQALLNDSLDSARASLERTTEKLASLKAAGVVDAGAQGFVYLLEGISDFVANGRITIQEIRAAQPGGGRDAAIRRSALDSLDFRFCTECMVSGANIDGRRLRAELTGLGDSLIVAGSSTTKRIHVHTNEPDRVFVIAGNHGEVSKRKVDDMLAQHQEILGAKSRQVAIITDSTCDLPQALMDEYTIRFAPLRVRIDGEEFVDKVDITPEEFFRRLPGAKSATSSQPAPADFKHVFEEALALHEEAVCIHIAAPLSGTGQSARTTARAYEDRVAIVDSNGLAMSLGLVVLEAARAAAEGRSRDEVEAEARRAAANVRFVVSLDSLEQAIKGGRVSRAKGFIAKALGIKPVLEFIEGKAVVAARPKGRQKSLQTLLDLTAERMAGKINPRFVVGHAGALEHAQWIAEQLRTAYGVSDIPIADASPVVSIHCGPRTVAIAMLGD